MSTHTTTMGNPVTSTTNVAMVRARFLLSYAKWNMRQTVRHLMLTLIGLFSWFCFLRIAAKPSKIPTPFPFVQTPLWAERASHWQRNIYCHWTEETWWSHLQTACWECRPSGWKHCRCIQLTDSAVNGQWIHTCGCLNGFTYMCR